MIPRPKNSRAWKKQEGRLDAEGVSRVPGSGNGVKKGDNRGELFLVQAKTTAKAQYPLKYADLRKAEDEAREEERIAVTQLQLKDQHRYAVLRWEDFEELLSEAGRAI